MTGASLVGRPSASVITTAQLSLTTAQPTAAPRARRCARSQQQGGDDADRLLRVVGAVAERQPRRRHPLACPHRAAPAARRPPRAPAGEADRQQRGEQADHGRDRQRQERAEHADGPAALDPAPVHGIEAAVQQARADQPADQRVARARGQAEPPRHQVPGHRAGEARADDGDRVGRVHGDDARHGVRDGGAEHERAEQVEDAGERRSLQRAHDPGGDGCGDRVRRVVDTVGRREREGERDRRRQAQATAFPANGSVSSGTLAPRGTTMTGQAASRITRPETPPSRTACSGP